MSRTCWVLLCCVIICALCALPGTALGQIQRMGTNLGQSGFSASPSHRSFVPSAGSSYFSYSGSGGPWRSQGTTFSAGFNGGVTTFSYSQGYPLSPPFYPGWGPYWGAPYYQGWGPYGAYSPWWGPVVVPPLFLPAETLYGPQALKRFFGFADDVAGPIAPAANAGAAAGAGFGVLAPEVLAQPARARPRVSNPEARARARRSVTVGDDYFTKQKFSDAYQRYRAAVQAAGDLPEGYFREAFALYALGRYESAVKALKRGLELVPDWPTQGFKLDVLYADNRVARAAHLEALAQEAAKAPSADLFFLLGVVLYCDGQRERSRPFFDRALLLAGADANTDYLAVFRRQLKPRAEAVAVPGPAAKGPPEDLPAPQAKPGVDL